MRIWREYLPLAIQFSVVVVLGCASFWTFYPHPNPNVPLYAGLLGGIFGGYAAMFLYVWVRYGWRAARSVSLDP